MKIQLTLKQKDILIISIRILLALVFLTYGLGKLLGKQFGGFSEAELNTPIKDLSLFKIAWYLFDHRSFKFFAGLCEIIAAALLLFRRTAIVGIFILIPIILNILVIDIMIMPPSLKIGFIFRLSFYLIFCGYVLWNYKEDLLKVWDILVAKREFPVQVTWKSYLWILVMMFLLEFGISAFSYLFKILSNFELFIEGLKGKF